MVEMNYLARFDGGKGEKLCNRPTYMEYKCLKFLVMDAPLDRNLSGYIEILEEYNVSVLVRLCELTYSQERVREAGIEVYDLSFPDGTAPSASIIKGWLELVSRVFKQKNNGERNRTTIAVHCVAGLGRAPLLVAIAFIKEGMNWLDCVLYIRDRRPGAINQKQLNFLELYTKHRYKSWGERACSII